MTHRTGWQRLLTVISAAWFIAIVAWAIHDYRSVVDGGDSTNFVSLQDEATGKSLGRLSRAEVKELGELLLKKSTSTEAEPTDAAEAKFLLEVKNLRPQLRYQVISLWIILPISVIWLFYASFVWVARGFRRVA